MPWSGEVRQTAGGECKKTAWAVGGKYANFATVDNNNK